MDVFVEAAPPRSIDVDGWDEVVEISLNAGGPGHCRVRVHARNRDHDVGGVDFQPVEEYLIVAWPAPLGPEVVHKQTDQYGAGRRRSASEGRL